MTDPWWWVIGTGVAAYFAGMFQPEIKSRIVGLWPALVERKYQAALRGDMAARRWCRRWMPKARRRELIEEARDANDHGEKLWDVMVACDPDMGIDLKTTVQERGEPDPFPGPA